MPLSADDLIKQDPTFITIQRARNNRGYLVFFATQPTLPPKKLTQLLIDDVLQAAVKEKNLNWLKKICGVIDINNPRECGGSSMLCLVLSDPTLQEMMPFLHQRKAALTAVEVIDFSKTHEITTRPSRRDSNILVIATDVGTRRYEIARHSIKEILNAAIDEIDANWIEYLIENRYLRMPPTLQARDCCWITLVSDIPREIKRIRAAQQELKMDVHETPYSSATFICPKINTSLYGAGGSAGFLIALTNRTVDYWYSGLSANGGRNEELTKDRSLAQLKQEAITKRDNQHFADIKETDLLAQMQRSIEFHWESLPTPKRSDRYGALKCLVSFPWNEGLIFYKSNEVLGIHYDPNNEISVEQAVNLYKAFKKNFKKELQFFCYDDGQIKKVRPPIAILQLNQTYSTTYQRNHTGSLFHPQRTPLTLPRVNLNSSAALNAPPLLQQTSLPTSTALPQISASQGKKLHGRK